MHAFALNALLTAALAMSSHGRGGLQAEAAPEPLDLMSALGASDVAEIYVISPGIRFPMTSRPETVREAGCKYLVHRESPQWGDLVRSLGEARVRFAPTTMRQDVRIGLVLSDWRGTVWEVYSGDLVWPTGRMNGFNQRRSVEISASFVTALQGFVARHRDLALPDSERFPRCPRQPRP